MPASRNRETVESVIYVAWFLNAGLGEEYGVDFENPAGLNKKRNLVEALDAVGVDVRVVSPVLTNQPSLRWRGTRRADDGIETVAPPMTGLPLLNIFLVPLATLVTLFREHRSDPVDAIIVYNYRPESMPAALVFRLLAGVPVVVEWEDDLSSGAPNPIVRTIAPVVVQLCRRFVDGGILVTSTFVDRLPTANYCIVRGIVSADQIGEESRNANAKPTVVYGGKIDQLRGAHTFARAIQHVNPARDVAFRITGFGADSEVEALKSELAVAAPHDREFLGFLPKAEYDQLIAEADVLLSLQDPEHVFSQYSFPSKIIEYMATGNTVVSTRVSDLESFAEGRVVLTDPDPEAVAEILETVLDDLPEYRDYGDTAAEWVAENCTPEPVGQAVRDVLVAAQ